MKRTLGIVLSVLILAAGLFALFGRGWLAERAFSTALDTSVGADQTAGFDDGLHAYVCGSGSPMPDATRAGPCIAVIAGRKGFVFDAGSGSIRKLQRMGFPMERIEGVYLTHLHSDHIDGLGELLLQAWVGGSRGAPVPVSGPEGTDKVVAGLMQAYEIDKGYRVAHHGEAVARPGGFGGAAQIITLPDGTDTAVVYDRDGIRITAIRVIHDPVKPAFGFRIDYKGRSISISGDTVYSPAFTAASKGVDLMFHEALNPEMIGRLGQALAQRGRKDSAKIMADIPGYHASPEDAARSAREAGAQTLVLYHLVPAPPARLMEPMFLGKAPSVFSGPLKLAEDGMLIHLPAGGKTVKFASGF